jgi:CheY-like chemotaxis protein
MALPQPATLSSAPVVSTRPRVLIVDDCDGTREVVAQILGQEFETVLADNGASAWERIEADPAIAGLITDIEMPGLNGYELIGRIRQSREQRIRSIPVIAITGSVENETRRRAFVSGATGMVPKPIDRHQLLALAHVYILQNSGVAAGEALGSAPLKQVVERDSSEVVPHDSTLDGDTRSTVIPVELISIDAALHAIQQGKSDLLVPFLSQLELRLRPLLSTRRPAAMN